MLNLRRSKRPVGPAAKAQETPARGGAEFHAVLTLGKPRFRTFRTKVIQTLFLVLLVKIGQIWGEWRGGVSPPRSLRTGREPVGSSGSQYPAVFERLCLGHAAPPVTGWPPAAVGSRSPFGPSLTGPSPLLRAAPPCAPHRSSGSGGGLPLELLPWHRDDRFPRSTTEPDPGSRRLQAGCRSGRAPGLRPNLSRRPLPSLRFRHRPVNFGTSSAVRLRSSLRISPDGIKSRLFCDAHHQRS